LKFCSESCGLCLYSKHCFPEVVSSFQIIH
jgi:hypothetical protein